MDTEQLEESNSEQTLNTYLENELLQRISNMQAASPTESGDYKPSEKTQRDYRDSVEDLAQRQQILHRNSLFNIVARLATASFILLAVMIMAQMFIRLFNSNYVGVSDAVIQIVAMSVFGQVLTVMGGLSYHLWKGKR